MEFEGDFHLPVDSEHKTTVFNPFRIKGVHMRAFHASWISFFTSFASTFAPAALAVVIRDDLNINKEDIGNAGIASITGTIICRIIMGTICDMYGPRFGHAFLMLLTAPAVFGMALITESTGYIICRFFIGFSLATFVACQYWSSMMFNVKIVGVANGTGAGWGNLGGGITQLIMPLIYAGMKRIHEPFVAWRYAFFIPGTMHILVGILVLFFTQDLPDGTYGKLKNTGAMVMSSSVRVFVIAVLNYRMWLMMVIYAFSFGVELTMNNVIVQYFYDHFNLTLTTSGALGSMFGFMNIFARSLGGITSDVFSKKFGMRGRLWILWSIQTLEGFLCLLLGFMKNSLTATITVMILFSITVQASEGAAYAVVPFISFRALGVVSGFIGAGGNAGSSFLQTIFFRDEKLETYEGITYMGILVIFATMSVIPIYFPMWGSMLSGPKSDHTEEDYYLSEYKKEEISAGLASPSVKFATESRSQRGKKQITEDKNVELTKKSVQKI